MTKKVTSAIPQPQHTLGWGNLKSVWHAVPLACKVTRHFCYWRTSMAAVIALRACVEVIAAVVQNQERRTKDLGPETKKEPETTQRTENQEGSQQQEPSTRNPEPRTRDRKPRTKNPDRGQEQEPRTTNQEPGTWGGEPRTKNQEPKNQERGRPRNEVQGSVDEEISPLRPERLKKATEAM